MTPAQVLLMVGLSGGAPFFIDISDFFTFDWAFDWAFDMVGASAVAMDFANPVLDYQYPGSGSDDSGYDDYGYDSYSYDGYGSYYRSGSSRQEGGRTSRPPSSRRRGGGVPGVGGQGERLPGHRQHNRHRSQVRANL